MFFVQKHYQEVSVIEKELVWIIWKSSFWFYDSKIVWVWYDAVNICIWIYHYILWSWHIWFQQNFLIQSHLNLLLLKTTNFT